MQINDPLLPGSSQIHRFLLRLAEPSDILPAKDFYLRRMSEASSATRAFLPIPSLLEIANAVTDRNFFVLTDDRGEIVAVSGLFRLLVHDDGLFLELSGMCTAGEVGGLMPRSVQSIMLIARILHAAYDLLGSSGGLALASFVHRDNRRSHDNLTAAGLREWAERPDWVRGEYVSWFGWEGGDDWLTLLVDTACVGGVFLDAMDLGFLSYEIPLQRRSRTDGATERFVIEVDRELFEGQFAMFIETDFTKSSIGTPPGRLSFSTRD